MTTYGATNDDKVVELTIFCFQCKSVPVQVVIRKVIKIYFDYLVIRYVDFVHLNILVTVCHLGHNCVIFSNQISLASSDGQSFKPWYCYCCIMITLWRETSSGCSVQRDFDRVFMGFALMWISLYQVRIIYCNYFTKSFWCSYHSSTQVRWLFTRLPNHDLAVCTELTIDNGVVSSHDTCRHDMVSIDRVNTGNDSLVGGGFITCKSY